MSYREPDESPTLVQVIAEMIEERLRSLWTMLPGTVTKVDKKTALISVQPDFEALYRDSPDTPKALPEIHGVPVWEARAGKARMSVPLAVGHKVTLIFASRSLESWKRDGSRAVPAHTRAHHLSDAIALPGLYAQSDTLPMTDNLVVEFGKAAITVAEDKSIQLKCVNGEFQVDKDGKFKLSNGTTDALKELSNALDRCAKGLDEFTKASFSTSLGPSGTVINPAPFVTLKSEHEKAKKLIDKMLG